MKRDGYFTDLVSTRAVKFGRDHAQHPFFLYVPHPAVPAPFQPPDALETSFVT